MFILDGVCRFFGGFLIENKGVNFTLIIGTIVAVIGSVVLWISAKPTKSN